jgi:hypothetical protein
MAGLSSGKEKPMKTNILETIALFGLCVSATAQVNSGSNGSDGALNFANPGGVCCYDRVIDMADHPDGIYHYTSINIDTGIVVKFLPNAKNSPVIWLVQGDCTINGMVDLSGQVQTNGTGGIGGPGGFRGGNGGNNPTPGIGPGGGAQAIRPYGNADAWSIANSASFASAGWFLAQNGPVAPTYGSQFLVPPVGGSGGGGGGGLGGGGGGGAILIAASNVTINGSVVANGGNGVSSGGFGNSSGAGSGGGIRIYANSLRGSGSLSASGGSFSAVTYWGSGVSGSGGNGRIRVDCIDNQFGGTVGNQFTQGFQPILVPSGAQGGQLNVLSVGGVALPTNPSGSPANPAAVISAQQSNPVAIVVGCSNIPLNTLITVTVRPLTGPSLSATGLNSSGTLSSSTAIVVINMPRGGGIIYATAAN